MNCQKNINIISEDHKYIEKSLEENGLNYSIERKVTYFDSFGELFKYLMKEENNFFIIHLKIKKLV